LSCNRRLKSLSSAWRKADEIFGVDRAHGNVNGCILNWGKRMVFCWKRRGPDQCRTPLRIPAPCAPIPPLRRPLLTACLRASSLTRFITLAFTSAILWPCSVLRGAAAIFFRHIIHLLSLLMSFSMPLIPVISRFFPFRIALFMFILLFSDCSFPLPVIT
jgi:hypothetical protein